MNKQTETPTFLVGRDKTRKFSADQLYESWKKHYEEDPLTKFIENYAENFIRNEMPAEEALLFVRMACAWGGSLHTKYFLKFRESFKETENLRDTLITVKKLSEQGKYADAIRAFGGQNGLGISFRSKVLRFLCPDHAAILDSIIRKHLGYEETEDDYAKFVSKCIEIREDLNAEHPDKKDWRTTDVEMGIFRSLVEDQ